VPFDPEDYLMKRRTLSRLTETLRAESYDIIHVHTPFMAHHFAVKLSKHRSIPVVETYHTHFEEYLHHYIPFLPKTAGRRIARSMARWLSNGVDGFITPSHAISYSLQHYGIDSPIQVVPTGLDLGEFLPGNRQAFCQRFGIDPSRPSLVYVGRVAFEKNIGLLIEVVAHVKRRLPEVLLIIAGEGPAMCSLKRMCESKGLHNNVLFVGYLPRGQPLWDCFTAGDLFVFGSKTETQGLVLLEAMALGVPVVAYAALGAGEVLTADAGAIIVEGGPEVFANAVVYLLQDRDERLALAEKGRLYARRWQTLQTTERLVDFYQSIIDRASESKQLPARNS
jgi:glycosyltransferase involved in cell wall biosynthesis